MVVDEYIYTLYIIIPLLTLAKSRHKAAIYCGNPFHCQRISTTLIAIITPVPESDSFGMARRISMSLSVAFNVFIWPELVTSLPSSNFSSKMCYIWCPRKKCFYDTFISAQTSMFTFYKPHTVKLCTGSEGFFCTVIAAIFSAGTTKCIRSHLCGLVFVLSKLPTNNGPSISHCLSL